MRLRFNDIAGIVSLALTLFFAALTVLFSLGADVDFSSPLVHVVLTCYAVCVTLSLFAARPQKRLSRRLGFYFTHAGIVLILLGFALFSLFGERVTAAVPIGGETYYSSVQRSNGEVCDLGFNFRIDDFSVETYEDGSDKQYTATVSFADAVTLRVEERELSVNHTLRRGGWKLYLMSYDMSSGDGYVELLLKRDPGEAVVISGAVLLLLGTVLMLMVGNAHVRSRDKDGGER